MLIKTITIFFNNKNRNYVLVTQIISAIIALISGKLIAIYVSPEDFGTYGIQFAAYTFFSTFLISPFIQFIKSANKTMLPRIGTKTYLFTLFVLVLLAYVCLIIFLNCYYDISWGKLLILLLVFIIFSTSNSLISDFFNIDNQIKDFSKHNILKALGSLLFIFVFFYFSFDFMSNVYVLWGMQLFGGTLGLILFLRKYPIYKKSIDFTYGTFLKKYLSFGGPLMFLAIWSWINNYFDRYAIEYFLPLEEVGVYNASYGVGSKPFLLLSPIFIVLLTSTVYSPIKKAKKKDTIKKYGFYYFVVGVPILVLLYFLSDFLGYLLLSESYKEGFHLIFWIALAFFMLTLAKLYELYFYSELKTTIILIGNVLSAVVNVILNIIFIPKYGILGAALATCFGFTVHFGVMYYNFRRK